MSPAFDRVYHGSVTRRTMHYIVRSIIYIARLFLLPWFNFSNYLRQSLTSRRRSRRIIPKLFIGAALIVVIVVCMCRFIWREPDYYTCPFVPVNKNSKEKCLDGYLHGTSIECGMGNVLFEVLSFVAIAKKTNRRPIISNKKTITMIERFLPYFPNMAVLFEKMRNTEGCDCFREVVHFNSDCCRVDEKSIAMIASSNRSTLRAHTYFTQGIRYLSFLSKSFVTRLIKGSDKVVQMARQKLFGIERGRYQKKNFCLHIRRGDFTTSSQVLETDAAFTRRAMDYILLREGRNMDIYAFGNDRIFMEEVFHNTNASLAVADEKSPPNIEFEFSRLYCDVTLLTASASTYGWWMGYLSRGQVVYYNANFSSSDGIELQMDRHQFFPSFWTPLELV